MRVFEYTRKEVSGKSRQFQESGYLSPLIVYFIDIFASTTLDYSQYSSSKSLVTLFEVTVRENDSNKIYENVSF